MRNAVFIILGVAGLLLAGCNNPQFRERQSVRDARIHSTLSKCIAHDKEGPEHIDELSDLHRKLRAQRVDHLYHGDTFAKMFY